MSEETKPEEDERIIEIKDLKARKDPKGGSDDPGSGSEPPETPLGDPDVPDVDPGATRAILTRTLDSRLGAWLIQGVYLAAVEGSSAGKPLQNCILELPEAKAILSISGWKSRAVTPTAEISPGGGGVPNRAIR